MAGSTTNKSGKAKAKTPVKKKGIKSKSITSFFSSGKKKSSPTSVTSTPKANDKHNDENDDVCSAGGDSPLTVNDTPLKKAFKKGTPTKKSNVKKSNSYENGAVSNIEEVRRSPRRSAANAAQHAAAAVVVVAAKKKKNHKNVLPDSSDDSSSDEEIIISKKSTTSTTKRSPSKQSTTATVVAPYYPIGTTLTKQFLLPPHNIRKLFTGTIIHYDARHKYYTVRYEDEDVEEMTEVEVGNFVLLRELCGKRGNDEMIDSTVGETDGVNDSGGGKNGAAGGGGGGVEKKVKKPRISEKKATATKQSPATTSTVKNAFDVLTNGKARGRTAKKQLNYADSDVEELDDEESEEERPKKKRVVGKQKAGASKAKAKTNGGTNNKTNNKKKKKSKVDDEESDEFQLGSESEDDSFVVDAVESESEMAGEDEDSSDDDYIGKNSRTKKGATKNATAAAKKKKPTAAAAAAKKPAAKPAAIKKKKGEPQTFEEMKAEKAKDIDVNKLNNPQSFPDDGPYVEPVGIDATGGIVEGIIAGMVQKVGKLLLASTKLTEEERDGGELDFPLKLNTACSGTDAPSIALGLVQENLNHTIGNNQHGFEYEHNMSCELEPFKQAYISRNFPDTKLFPDITKLTGGETVTDVYGREQTIPESNLFIAGTSCKDFSMLKSSHRKDIEDKGTSGETFLAAVEYLEQEQPKMAIFENVQNAPWEKMQEYIEGRIDLKDRNAVKGICGIKKGNADKELKFEIDEQGRYVVSEVPKQIGARAGCLVEGFVRGDDDPNEIQPMKCKQSNKGKTLSLGELAKKHGIDLENDKLVIEKKARYCTHLVKLDTREYGLPQTRNRKYLFVWLSDDPEDELGGYIQLIMDHLKTPLLHSMEAFLLPETHDRIRCFREALRSGPGLMVAKERAKELDFFDWELSGVKDLAYHVNYREKHGINQRARWLTQWGPQGRRLVTPVIWPELLDMWNHRRLDLIDCFSAGVVRDAVSRDPNHHSFTWDLSQNVHRTDARKSTVGVSGCVTPGCELLLPHKGRTMMGFEKLLLQGIPFSRLALGPETEVQLSDLAGNAMSVPVITACMLAGICAFQLRREQKSIENVNLKNFALSQKYDHANGGVLAERGDLYKAKPSSIKDFAETFARIGDSLAVDAFRCSVLCNCETSGQMSPDEKVLECSDCGLGICHACTSRHQVGSHSLIEIITSDTKRVNPHEFEMKLRCAAPSVLVLGKGWEDAIPEATGLESYSFQLQRVDRMRGHWLLTYGAWEDHGSGRQVAEIRVALGQIGALQRELGVAAYVKCFSPAIRHDNPKRGALADNARLILRKKGQSIDFESAAWEVKGAKPTKSSLNIVGSDPIDSTRIQVGLNDDAAKGLKNHKVMKKFTKNFPKSRNSLLHYHKKWKNWPGTIVVSGDENDASVNGTYKKMRCEHSIVLSALWKRDEAVDSPALYLYLRPDVMRTDLDVAVISTTPSYRDNMEICELKDWIPENALVEGTHSTGVRFLSWELAPSLKLAVPEPAMRIKKSAQTFHDQVDTSKSTSSPILCEMSGLSTEGMESILQNCIDDGNRNVVTIDLYRKMGTLNAKKLSILAAPSLLKCAAEGQLPLDLLRWYKLEQPKKTFGLCENNCPSRPVEKWTAVKSTAKKGKTTTEVVKYERGFDAKESSDFYQTLMNRPPAFEASVDKANGKLIIRMNPLVAGHQAAAHLVRGRGLDEDVVRSVDVSYSLSELSRMGEPKTKEFHVPNSDAFEETHVEDMELPLYPRQAKALTRMRDIEAGKVEFTEEERSEHTLSGIGWCLIGKASKMTPLKGGVLGDAIGSGKTVVTIALILKGIEEARAKRSVNDGKSGATLIVVPPGLLAQWDDERKKFTKNKLKCIIVDSTLSLQRRTVKEICEADMVIVPAGIIEDQGKTIKDRPYTELLTNKANGIKIPPAPSNGHAEAPTIEGTWVRNMQSGPSIYVGNTSEQKHRDEQAYYGYAYAENIKKLRTKNFDPDERGVPLEYFSWDRVIVDECHECLVSTKRQDQVSRSTEFKVQARRGAREFLGVGCTDASARPLVARTAFWGLTGTPLLETEARVTELANLMGGTYLTGSAHHWRKEERESGRDIFLNQQEEGSKSREYRCAIHNSCHDYVGAACQRNRGEQLAVQLERKQIVVNMTESDGAKFLKAIKVVNLESYSIRPDQLGEKAGDVLTVTASSTARREALFEIIDSIQKDEPHTKIIIFANAVYGGHESALSGLKSSGRKFCHVDDSHSVLEQNEIISWFRHTDATEEDRARPRILLLSFNQAAGHNLQEACHHVIMYDPMYSGSDAVADASVEEQALGRVMRQGQREDVTCYRILVKGPNGEKCLDDCIIERNLDEDVLRAATSNFD